MSIILCFVVLGFIIWMAHEIGRDKAEHQRTPPYHPSLREFIKARKEGRSPYAPKE